MGKAKKRNFHSCIKTGGSKLPPAFSRSEAINMVICNIKAKNYGEDTKDIISLFGITAEELAEAGAAYEDLVALKTAFI